MAVYQGARRQVLLPRPGRAERTAAPPQARRQAAGLVRRSPRRLDRAQGRVRPVVVAMAVLLAVFLVGLVYLTQALQAGALEHELSVLGAERDQLNRDLRNLEGNVLRGGSEPFLLDWGQQHGLSLLGDPLRVPGP